MLIKVQNREVQTDHVDLHHTKIDVGSVFHNYNFSLTQTNFIDTADKTGYHCIEICSGNGSNVMLKTNVLNEPDFRE